MDATDKSTAFRLGIESGMSQKFTNEFRSLVIWRIKVNQSVRFVAKGPAKVIGVMGKKCRLWKVVQNGNYIFIQKAVVAEVDSDLPKGNFPPAQFNDFRCGNVLVENIHSLTAMADS